MGHELGKQRGFAKGGHSPQSKTFGIEGEHIVEALVRVHSFKRKWLNYNSMSKLAKVIGVIDRMKRAYSYYNSMFL